MKGIVKTNTILDSFVNKNIELVQESRRKRQLNYLQNGIKTTRSPKNYFLSLLQAKKEAKKLALIAEIKRASPSLGDLNKKVDVARQSKIYEESGVAAISVVTQPFKFNGSMDDLRKITALASIPVLRKDFIIDSYQIYEAKLAGASAVLLIAMILEKSLLEELLNVAFSLGLDTLVEVHKEHELENVLDCEVKAIGVNARDLETFEVDLTIVERILPKIPGEIVKVAESGIVASKDVWRVRRKGADAILVGSSIMQSKNPAGKIRELLDF